MKTYKKKNIKSKEKTFCVLKTVKDCNNNNW